MKSTQKGIEVAEKGGTRSEFDEGIGVIENEGPHAMQSEDVDHRIRRQLAAWARLAKAGAASADQ